VRIPTSNVRSAAATMRPPSTPCLTYQCKPIEKRILVALSWGCDGDIVPSRSTLPASSCVVALQHSWPAALKARLKTHDLATWQDEPQGDAWPSCDGIELMPASQGPHTKAEETIAAQGSNGLENNWPQRHDD